MSDLQLQCRLTHGDIQGKDSAEKIAEEKIQHQVRRRDGRTVLSDKKRAHWRDRDRTEGLEQAGESLHPEFSDSSVGRKFEEKQLVKILKKRYTELEKGRQMERR